MLLAVIVLPIIFAPILLKFSLFPELSSNNKGLLMRVFLGVLFDGQGGSFKILLTLLLSNLGVLTLIIF